MKKIYSLLFIMLLASVSSQACNVCGCKLSGLYFGLLPMKNMHFFGLRYNFTSFDAKISHKVSSAEFSHDAYRRIEAIARIGITDRLQLRAIIPFAINSMRGNEQNIDINGISDPTIMVYYQVYRTNTGSDFQQSAMLGGGIKLPFGKHNQKDDGEIINRNFQLGTGSLDYSLSLNYTARYKNAGISAESTYQINTRDNNQYKFGNQWNVSSSFFYYVETPKVSILPFVGGYYEQAEQHRDGKFRQDNTGGALAFVTAGVQFFRQKWTVNTQYMHPISQNLNTENHVDVQANGRFSISLMYSFSFK